jgi:hypothetical protein
MQLRLVGLPELLVELHVERSRARRSSKRGIWTFSSRPPVEDRDWRGEVILKLAIHSRRLRHSVSYYYRRSELRSAGVEGGRALWACVPL